MAVQPLPEQRGPLVRDGLAVVAIALAGLAAVVLFLPADGWLATPLHSGLVALLGRTAFILPLVLLLAGILTLGRGRRFPKARVLGLAVLAVSVLPAQHFLLPQSAGELGRWLAEALLSAVGGIGAALIVLPALAAGTFLVFRRAAQ